MSANAEDLLIARSARNKDMILASIQREVDKVVALSDKARLTFNTSKCETALFSLDCTVAAWQLNITNVPQSLPGLPGCQIRSTAHHCRALRKLCQSISGRFNLLCALGGTNWGWHTSDCRQAYIAIVRSMLENAAAAWAHWLSATFTSKHYKVQLEATRAITGLVRSTQDVAVLGESQLPPISTHFQTISLLRADEWAHLPRSSSSPSHCMQTAPEEERLAQHSISLSESTWSQSPGHNSNSPSCEQFSIPSLDKPLPIPTVITPVDKRMQQSQQIHFPSKPCLHPPTDFQI